MPRSPPLSPGLSCPRRPPRKRRQTALWRRATSMPAGSSCGCSISASGMQSRSFWCMASAQLGPEINADFITGFVRAQRRREAQEVLALLVHDPALISRAMVEDVLRYKRLDGVAAALEAIAADWFPGGVQRVGNAEIVRNLRVPV